MRNHKERNGWVGLNDVLVSTYHLLHILTCRLSKIESTIVNVWVRTSETNIDKKLENIAICTQVNQLMFLFIKSKIEPCITLYKQLLVWNILLVHHIFCHYLCGNLCSPNLPTVMLFLVFMWNKVPSKNARWQIQHINHRVIAPDHIK